MPPFSANHRPASRWVRQTLTFDPRNMTKGQAVALGINPYFPKGEGPQENAVWLLLACVSLALSGFLCWWGNNLQKSRTIKILEREKHRLEGIDGWINRKKVA